MSPHESNELQQELVERSRLAAENEWQGVLDKLSKHALQKNLVQRAIESCAKCWTHDADSLEYKLDDLRMEYSSTALYFNNAKLSYPYFDTRLRLYLGTKEVGYYRLITFLDGSVADDYLVFH